MHIDSLVTDVKRVIEALRAKHGEFKLAMLYNYALVASSNWNLIVSSDWTDKLGLAEATHLIARELHEIIDEENRPAISRVTVLKTGDPFVRDMTFLYPVHTREAGIPVSQVTAGDVSEGAGFLFYSQPEIAA